MHKNRMMPGMTRRVIEYAIGMAILALGITLNTKTTLGVTPIVAPAFGFAQIRELPFGDVVFIWYMIFLLMEMIIHQSMRPHSRWKIALKDFLQMPVCLLFTRCMNLFSASIPTFEIDMPGTFLASFAGRFIMLLLAVILTGIGAAMTMDMRLMPNPADGLVQAIADKWERPLSFIKNAFDISNVFIALAVTGIMAHTIVGIGIGTIVAALGIGRVIKVYHKIFGGIVMVEPVRTVSRKEAEEFEREIG